MVEVLDEFPSVKPFAPLLLLHLTPLQPRFYSISSSPDVHQGQIHLTVAIVQYTTQGIYLYLFVTHSKHKIIKKYILGGSGPIHYGVCSNYLREISDGEPLYVFVRR